MDSHQTSIFTAVLITCIVLAVTITYFIIIIIRNQRRIVDLYKGKVSAEITTMENERSRIANDLHDEVGPILSSVKLRMNNIEVSTKDDAEEMKIINRNIDEMIQKMRSISNDLMPIKLQRKGLIAAVQEFIGNVKAPSTLNIQFRHENISDLPKDKSIHMYRILLEIIHNTIKHANASQLRIEITMKNNMLIILSKDDGRGYDFPSVINESMGLGLRSLLSRTEILGGEMFVESKKGEGTQYSFEIPMT